MPSTVIKQICFSFSGFPDRKIAHKHTARSRKLVINSSDKLKKNQNQGKPRTENRSRSFSPSHTAETFVIVLVVAFAVAVAGRKHTPFRHTQTPRSPLRRKEKSAFPQKSWSYSPQAVLLRDFHPRRRRRLLLPRVGCLWVTLCLKIFMWPLSLSSF